jgi:hypothetical protein
MNNTTTTEATTPKKRHTSTAVQRRYMDKTYTRLYVDVQKQLAATFKERTAERGDTTAEIFRNAIKAYLAKTEEN